VRNHYNYKNMCWKLLLGTTITTRTCVGNYCAKHVSIRQGSVKFQFTRGNIQFLGGGFFFKLMANFIAKEETSCIYIYIYIYIYFIHFSLINQYIFQNNRPICVIICLVTWMHSFPLIFLWFIYQNVSNS
jgi:hypothetical protein